MRFNSTLIASLQGSVTGGQELEVPELLLPTIELPLPLAGVTAPADMQNLPHTVHIFNTINQGASLPAITNPLITLDRGVYRFKGFLYGHFVGIPATSADPFGAVLQLLAPGGVAAITIVFTNLADETLLSTAPVPFDYLYQITQPGWIIQVSTFHATGVGDSIGVVTSLQVSRML